MGEGRVSRATRKRPHSLQTLGGPRAGRAQWVSSPGQASHWPCPSSPRLLGASGPPGPGPSPACRRSPSPELRGPDAPQAQPCHQARRRPWGWGAGDGWAGCIPVFFAELGVGFSDIQAFTEHCFTTAGTKRENRVTDAAPPGGPGGRTSAQLHTSWAWPTWPQARHTGTRGGQAGECRGHSAPHPSDLLGGGAGQALEDAQHPPPALGPLQPQPVARWGPLPSGQARRSSGAWSGSGRLGGPGRKGLSGDRRDGPQRTPSQRLPPRGSQAWKAEQDPRLGGFPCPAPCSRRVRREGRGVARMRWAPRQRSACTGQVDRESRGKAQERWAGERWPLTLGACWGEGGPQQAGCEAQSGQELSQQRPFSPPPSPVPQSRSPRAVGHGGLEPTRFPGGGLGPPREPMTTSQ